MNRIEENQRNEQMNKLMFGQIFPNMNSTITKYNTEAT